MAMASGFYNAFKAKLFSLTDSIDLDSAGTTIKVMLVTNTYTPDFDTHDFVNDVTNEVTGTGYTAGGQALTTKTVTQDNTNDRGVFDADDVTWASSTITARGAVLYKDTGSAATSPLIYALNFGSDFSSSSGNFTIVWDSTGIFRIT